MELAPFPFPIIFSVSSMGVDAVLAGSDVGIARAVLHNRQVGVRDSLGYRALISCIDAVSGDTAIQSASLHG